MLGLVPSICYITALLTERLRRRWQILGTRPRMTAYLSIDIP